MPKKRLILTGGGDCPGLNAVIRAIVKSAAQDETWECWGSIRAFNGILDDPPQLVRLDRQKVSGIHVNGGTILQTVNKGDPFHFPTIDQHGNVRSSDVSHFLVQKVRNHGFDAVVNIGGDGSQKISAKLFRMGVPIIGVPKTIDNDLDATDVTFGFQTAVEIATEAVDKLVSTAASHNRVMVAEVMGRDAGWIALHSAIAAGADVALIPEIPYQIDSVVSAIKKRVVNGVGFAIIVIAEGAKPLGGTQTIQPTRDPIASNPTLRGVGYALLHQIQQKMDVDARVTVLGHIQRGGTPIAYDRVLATQLGVKAFELVCAGEFGQMVSFYRGAFTSVPIEAAIATYKTIQLDDHLIRTARKLGMCLGD